VTAPTVLLSLDEARDCLGASAVALVEAVACSPARLVRLLAGRGTTRGLPPAARQAVSAHRSTLRQVLGSDHAWILEEEIEGALSYAEHLGRPSAAVLAA